MGFMQERIIVIVTHGNPDEKLKSQREIKIEEEGNYSNLNFMMTR